MTTAVISHILLDSQDIAWIADANTKVIEIACDHKAYGWSVEEMHQHHPHLSLAQLHAAMAYYYDHQQDLDAEIQRRLDEVNRMAIAAGETPGRRRLREAGVLQ